MVAFSTIADWKHGILELLYSSGMWLGAFLVIALLAARKRGAPWPRRRVPPLVAVVVLLGLLALLGGAAGAVLFSAAPLVCLAAFVAGLRLAAGPRAAALSAFGLTGLLLSYRRPFHIGDSAYVGPPLLFALVCAIGLLRLAVGPRRTASPAGGCAGCSSPASRRSPRWPSVAGSSSTPRTTAYRSPGQTACFRRARRSSGS